MTQNVCDPRIKNAIEFATHWHDIGARKGIIGGTTIPYIVHPIRVMELVWKWGAGTVENLCAAVCHDVLEDTKATIELLRNSIGGSAEIVLELTFQDGFNNNHERGVAKANYMKTFFNSSLGALIIKLADRICNVLDFAMTDIRYARIYFNKAAVLFDAFAERQDEIAKVYGENTRDNIGSSIQALRGMLFGTPLNPIFTV